MKAEKDNRTLYQNTFDEVHASEDLLRKVEAMKHENGILKKTMSKGMIAAAAFGVLVFSNVISYAASGNAWILTITLPDGETRQIGMEPGLEDGQSFDYEGVSDSVSSVPAANAEVKYAPDASDDGTMDAYRLETADGRTWLVLDEQHRIDITEDFRDGSCKGTFDLEDGVSCYSYEVTGTPEEPDIQVYLITCKVK